MFLCLLDGNGGTKVHGEAKKFALYTPSQKVYKKTGSCVFFLGLKCDRMKRAYDIHRVWLSLADIVSYFAYG